MEKVQSIIVDGDQVLVEHGIPALEGDFLQRLGRRATQINLRGFLTGPEVADGLKALRDKFRAAEPVAFVADIATATQVGDVLIEEMGVREIAGKPERFEYAFLLREFIPAPPTRSIEPPPPPVPPPPPPSVKTGVLIVEVIVEGQPNFDFNKVTVTVEGTEESGVTLSRTLTNRTENRWTENEFPPGDFTAEALVSDPDAMSGSVSAAVRAGQTTQVQITLRGGANIAKAFVVHFWFDKAFIEPCLRPIMREIAQYAADHPSEKLIIIGHTDLVGSDNYNQSLSERRGRSAYAYLTFGRDKATALDEWDQLRQNRPAGQLPSIHDTWSVREYQYMLQDIGYYIGSIDEDHGPKTDTAIRGFQQDNGLTVNGTMDNPTWRALIDAYLSQDNLSVSEDQFIANAKNECDGGIVKWLGCGEKDPVKNTQDAWRPNRRTEFLFTTVSVLPCEIPEPVTFELPQPNIVGTNWCLGSGDTNKRCCFTTHETEQPDKLLIRPAKPEKTLVNGIITFEDGTPVANAKYALIAPDGEYLHTDSNGNADLGERPQQPNRGRPIPDRADDNGRFTYPRETPVGTYILELFELDEPEIAREVDEPPEAAKGNVICLELDQEPEIVQRNLDLEGVESVGATADLPQLHALVQSAFVAQQVNPSISPPSTIVLVKKSYTTPARRLITLRASVTTNQSGTLTRLPSGPSIRLFDQAAGGTEIFVTGTGHTFTGAELSSNTGVQLFAESEDPSGTIDDYQLTLTLAPGPMPVGNPQTASMTAVKLGLDISLPRTTSVGPQMPLLPQPPTTPPSQGAIATDKWFGGIQLNVQDPGNNQLRARLLVGQVVPSVFTGELVLKQIEVSGNNTLGVDDKVQVFDDELPGSRQTPPISETPKPNPFEFNTSTLFFNFGRQFFIQGADASTALRDNGFQLGIKDVDDDGDRVAITVVVAPVITLDFPIVVVKKPHTNPARRVVTLRVSTSFNGSGTLTRSTGGPPIRWFDQPNNGTEIDVSGTGHTLTGAALSANTGVQLFAESLVPSGAEDDYELTLTLAPGTTQVGAPQTVSMTAVELTLDVRLSRPSSGAVPPLMSANDKINIGRFVQVRDPGFSHERAMIILRPPNPPVRVDVVLTSINSQVPPINPLVQAFNQEVPGPGQNPIQNDPVTFPSILLEIAEFEMFIEGTSFSTAVRDTGFRYGIQGLEDEADRVIMTAVQFDVTTTASASVTAASFVRFGLWDEAFDPSTGNLRNGAINADHFIGSDSRHFFFRVRDLNAVGNQQMEWRTVNADGTADHAPVGQSLQLVETTPNSHQFFSDPVFLVSDDDDRDLTSSGLPAATVDLLLPRIRKVTVDDTHQLDGRVFAIYTPAPGQVMRTAQVLFERSSEERRRIRVHLVNVRSTVGGTGVLSANRRNMVTRVIHSMYAVCGVFVEVDEFEIDPEASSIGWPGPHPDPGGIAADPGVEGFSLPGNFLVASTSQSDLITAVRNLPTFDINDDYIIFVNRIYNPVTPTNPNLTAGSRGQSFPDTWVPATSNLRSFAFVGLMNNPSNYTEVHELTHITTNLRNSAGGHFDLAAGDLRDDRNLMRRGTRDGLGVLDTKRLWDTQFVNPGLVPSTIARQIESIRRSRFIRNF